MKSIAPLFKSLEDETRLRIMSLLLDAEELCVCDLIAVLQLPQSTVSRHLAILKNAGWLKDRRAGIWIHYSIAQNLSAAHGIMIDSLRGIFEHEEIAGNDRKRLEKLGTTNCCA